MVQQPRPEPAILPVVVDDHRDLGIVLAGPAVESGDPHDLLVHHGHHRLVELVVEPGQVQERGPAGLRHRGEEPVVDRLRRKAVEHAQERVHVSRLDEPDRDARPVDELDGAAPLR
jgi:hypothetical protein